MARLKTVKKKSSKRVGTSQTKKSVITGKTPSKRLKKRRKKNVRAGYYPNPIKPDTYIGIAESSSPSVNIFAVILHGKKQDLILALDDNKREAQGIAIHNGIDLKVPVKIVSTTGRVEFKRF